MLLSSTEQLELEGTPRIIEFQLLASHSTQIPWDCSAGEVKSSIKLKLLGERGQRHDTSRVRLPPVQGILWVFKAQPGDSKKHTKQHIQK